ncbi:MAG: M28 family peptidase, partial [Bacteroidales bacterium]
SAQVSTPAGRLETHVHTLAADSLLGRGFGTPQGRIAASYIAGQFRKAGIEPLNGDYFHPFSHRHGVLNIRGTNVAGVIPGSNLELRDEYIVLGAHYDHLGWDVRQGDTVVYNGADDNASGTASIIEIGRELAAKRDSLGRSIILVAFDGEESGLIGSSHFVEDSIVPPGSIKLMFSLDMVGMYEKHGGVDLHGVQLLNDAGWLTGELSQKHRLALQKTNDRIIRRTDTAPFGNIGIPAVHVFTGTESPYHQPEDVPGLLDYEGMALIAGYLSEATLFLSAAEDISEMTLDEEALADSGPGIFTPGIRVGLGSGQHNYRDEFYKAKSILAAEAGLYLHIRLTEIIYLQPEILYETSGSKHPDGNFRTHSVTVPLNVVLSTPRQGSFSSYVRLGGYYSRHFGGKVGGEKIDFQDIYNQQDWGLAYGFGFNIMNVQWGVHFRNGFSGILQDGDAAKILPENVFVMLGFTF